MAVSTYGNKGKPEFSDLDAPDVAVNPTAVGTYAAKVGNRRVGTTAEREIAASSGDVWDGLLWGDTTDGSEYRYVVGSGWRRIWSPGSTPYATAAGVGSVTFSGQTTNFTITIPAGKFTVAPIVNILSRSNVTAPIFSAVATNATTVNVLGTQGGAGLNLPYQWIAVQMTPTSAAS